MPSSATLSKSDQAKQDSFRALGSGGMNEAEPDGKMSLSAILNNPRLPSPPAVVLQIVEKASRPDCNPDEIIALLGQDSGLCCQVLKTVNSGLYGLSKPVGSPKQAVMLLGIRPLRSLVLSVALPAIGTQDNDELILKYWQESVAGAVIARELAVHLRRKDPDDDLVAGLLRDLGMLVLREAFKDDYRALWARSAGDWSPKQCALEKETFGVDHTEISAGLLADWNLPPEIYLPIRHHHDPAAFEDATPPMLERAWILCFASKVATLGSNAPQTIGELLQIAKTHFKMEQAALIKFLGAVMPAIKEFAGLLKVEIGTIPNYAGIIGAGCQELVRLSAESSHSHPPGSGTRAASAEPASTASATDVTRVTKRPSGSTAVAAPAADTDAGATSASFDTSYLSKMPKEGFRLGAYEIKEILGRGGMGVVFKAYDPALDRYAAVKMMTPQHVVMGEGRERFKREARAVAGIQHENVVTIYAVSEVNGLPYLVMEYLPGTSLQDRVDKEGALPMKDVISFGRQIAMGLQAAHAKRIIHRDIKPANIMFGSAPGAVKITDFGLARALDQAQLSQPGTVVGTPLYMAPEQFNSSSVDHRADLFSLGSLLYTLCTGRTPFKGESVLVVMRQVSTATPISLRTMRPETPPWLIDVIGKLMAKLPAARYQSASEVVQAFAAH